MSLDEKKISELARATSVRDDSLLVIDNGGTESNSVYVEDLLKKAAANKQDRLTAGQNIKIENNVISAPAINARNIGEIIPSVLPLKDAGLHLLDGTLIYGNGIYGEFVDYISDLYDENPNASYFAKSTNVVLSWLQPYMTTNGIIGTSSFALSSNVSQLSGSSDIYTIMNNVTGAGFHSVQGTTTGYIDFYSSTPLRITNIHVTNQTDSGGANRASAAGTIYGSNDGTNWTTLVSYTNTQQAASGEWDITIPNTSFYNYYRWESTTGGSGGYWTIAHIKITATQNIALTAEGYWQHCVSEYGSCGKFVYDSTNNTVRLPRIDGFIESTIDFNKLGNLTEAGLPNIIGKSLSSFYLDFNADSNSAIYGSTESTGAQLKLATGSAGSVGNAINIDASRSNTIYGNSDTVQPQSVQVLYYIVVATSIINDTNADASQVTSLINFKANNDLSNVNLPAQNFIAQSMSWGMPDYTRGVFIDRNTLQGWTAPTSGILFGKVDWNSTGGWIYVNGYPTVAGVGERSSIGGIPLSKGDVVTYTNFDMNDNDQFYFYPFKQAF